MKIDFNKPYVARKDLKYIKSAIESVDRGAARADSKYTKKVQTFIE